MFTDRDNTKKISIQELSNEEAQWLVMAIESTVANQLNTTKASVFLEHVAMQIKKITININS